MAEPKAPTQSQIDQAIQDHIDALKDVAASSTDPCLTAKYIAVRNPEVQDLLKKLLRDPARYAFHGIYCPEDCGTYAWQDVVFDFRCRPGVFCLVEPRFLVGVDVRHQRVAYVQNPYIPDTARAWPCLDIWAPSRLICDFWGVWLESRVALWQALCSTIPCKPAYSRGSPRLLRPLKHVRPSPPHLLPEEA